MTKRRVFLLCILLFLIFILKKDYILTFLKNVGHKQVILDKYWGNEEFRMLSSAQNLEIKLTDEQIKPLIDYALEISPNGGVIFDTDDQARVHIRKNKLWGDAIQINFVNICSMKLKDALIQEFSKEYIVTQDLVKDDWLCNRKPTDPMWLEFDIKGIDANTIFFRFSTSVAFSNEAIFRWNGVKWDIENVLMSAGTWSACSKSK